MTTITITDPVLLKQLVEAKGLVIFRDPDGNIVHASGGELWAPPEGYVPPISQEELDRRSATFRSGIPHGEVMKRLKGHG